MERGPLGVCYTTQMLESLDNVDVFVFECTDVRERLSLMAIEKTLKPIARAVAFFVHSRIESNRKEENIEATHRDRERGGKLTDKGKHTHIRYAYHLHVVAAFAVKSADYGRDGIAGRLRGKQ